MEGFWCSGSGFAVEGEGYGNCSGCGVFGRGLR